MQVQYGDGKVVITFEPRDGPHEFAKALAAVALWMDRLVNVRVSKGGEVTVKE